MAEAMSQLLEKGDVRGPKPLRGDNQVLEVDVLAITDQGFQRIYNE